MASLNGKIVEWTSQSRGFTRTKRGMVIYDGEPFTAMQHASQYLGWHSIEDRAAFACCSGSQDKTGYRRSCSTGVLVKVTRTGTQGRRLKPHYYSPRRSSLRVVE